MKTLEVVVVGAGIVGSAAAFELARSGASVTLIDTAAPGCITSAAGMGHVVVMDDSVAQLALTQFSSRLWSELASAMPDAVEREVCGTLWVAADREEMNAVLTKQSVYERAGVRVEVLDQAALRAAEPHLRSDLVGALRTLDDSVVYPPVAARWFASRPGIAFEMAEVRSLGDGAVHLASGRVLRADVIVNAAGNRALQLLARPLKGARIRPRKGHLVITERYPGYCRHQLVELGYLKSAHAHDPTSVAFNIQPRATGQLLLGSSRQYDVEHDAVEPEVLAKMIARAQHYLPDIGSLRVLRTWTGFRGATVDKLPLIGAHPQDPSVLIAAGHEGLGITTATGTARLIADHVFRRRSEIDPMPYRASRFEDVVS